VGYREVGATISGDQIFKVLSLEQIQQIASIIQSGKKSTKKRLLTVLLLNTLLNLLKKVKKVCILGFLILVL